MSTTEAQPFPAQQPLPAAPGPKAAHNGFAIAALSIGIPALVLAFIPLLSFVAMPLAIVATVFAVIALVLAHRGRRGRKAMAWTSLIISVAAIALSIVGMRIVADATDQLGKDLKQTNDKFSQDMKSADDKFSADMKSLESSR